MHRPRGRLELRFCLTSVLLAGVLGQHPAKAAPLLEPENSATPLAEASLEALNSGHVARAESLVTQYIELFPDDPLAWLLRFKVRWWSILEGRAEEQAALQDDYERLQEVATSRLARDRDDLRALVALGEAHCAMGRLQGIRGEGWSAVQSHRRGVPLLEQALALDPDLVEPLVSLGVYHYYAARASGLARFLGRLLQVHADRRRGLQELWRAATTPGLQQFEATFFLVEILGGMEDDGLEAFPLARRLQSRFPDSLPATVSLASVHLVLDRPDLAVAVLMPLATREGPRRAAARFFVGRTLCVSGRMEEGLEFLEGFTSADLDEMTWLQGWHAYYRGLAYEQLGRSEEARQAFEAARRAPEVADSRRLAQRALDRQGSLFERRLRAAEASLVWDRDREAAQTALRLQWLDEDSGSEESRRRARLALAVMALQQDAPQTAVELLLPLVREDEAEEAWLVTRPRIRLLQALWTSGRREEAVSWAARFAPALGDWGSNRQLELLVRTCTQPQPVCDSEGTGGMAQADSVLARFQLRDTGFTVVQLQLLVGEVPISIPMRLHAGFWDVATKLGQGAHLYRFDLECLQTFPDPTASDFRQRDDGNWSVRIVTSVDSASSAVGSH